MTMLFKVVDNRTDAALLLLLYPLQGKAKRGGAAWEAQMERHETMQFVVGQLGDDLFRELLDGLRLLV